MQIRRGDRVAGETGSTLPALGGLSRGVQPVMVCRRDLGGRGREREEGGREREEGGREGEGSEELTSPPNYQILYIYTVEPLYKGPLAPLYKGPLTSLLRRLGSAHTSSE